MESLEGAEQNLLHMQEGRGYYSTCSSHNYRCKIPLKWLWGLRWPFSTPHWLAVPTRRPWVCLVAAVQGLLAAPQPWHSHLLPQHGHEQNEWAGSGSSPACCSPISAPPGHFSSHLSDCPSVTQRRALPAPLHCAWATGAVRWAPYLDPGHRAGLRATSGRLSTVPSTQLQDPSGWYPRVSLALGMGSDVLAARKLGGLAAIIVPISFHLRNEKAHFSYTMLAYINNNEPSSLGHLFQMLHPQGAKTCCVARSWLLPSQSVPKTFLWVINSKPYGSA